MLKSSTAKGTGHVLNRSHIFANLSNHTITCSLTIKHTTCLEHCTKSPRTLAISKQRKHEKVNDFCICLQKLSSKITWMQRKHPSMSQLSIYFSLTSKLCSENHSPIMDKLCFPWNSKIKYKKFRKQMNPH